MEHYEIRILRLDGSPGLIAERTYLNADAAIAAGKVLAAGRRFEVWNEDRCIYAGSKGHAGSSVHSRPSPSGTGSRHEA